MKKATGLTAGVAVGTIVLLMGCAQDKTEQEKKARRLSASEVRSLLLGNTEVGVLKRPSGPVVEGYEDQTYKAYYQNGGTVWYNLDGSREIKKWDFKIWDSGEVCRGPKMGVQSWCRVIVPDGSGGYIAIGFQTGEIRYCFRVEEGIFGFSSTVFR